MATLLVGGGYLAYQQVKKQKQKRAQRRADNDARFAELERDNAERIANLQSNTCFCQQSDWTGGECTTHGYVPPATSSPSSSSFPSATRQNQTVSSGDGSDPWDRRASSPLDEPPVYMRDETGSRGHTQQMSVATAGDDDAYGDKEREKINEERRLRMKTGKFTNWRLKKKGKSANGEPTVDQYGVVRS